MEEGKVDAEEVETFGEGQEGKPMRGAKTPVKPSRQEVQDHNRCHIPFRTWCAHCMRGKAKASPHSGNRNTEHGKPIVAIDYAFLGIERGGTREEWAMAEAEAIRQGHTPTLVMVDSQSKAIFAHAVNGKGVDDVACRQIVDDLDTLGYKEIVFKSDQEPAIVALGEIIKASWNGDMALEYSPVGESQSNGMVERGIQTWEGQVRTLKDALEARIDEEIPPDHPVLTWLVEHAATLVRRCAVGADGTTPQEKIKGRASHRPGFEFGERVWYRPARKGTKLEPVVSEGVYLGVQDRSDESLIGTPEGPVKCRDVRARPDDEKWGKDILKIKYTTMKPNEGSEDVRIKTYFKPGLANSAVPRPTPEVTVVQTRRCRLYPEDFEKHGTTI